MKEFSRVILFYLRNLASLVGVMATGTVTVLLWALAVLALVPLALGVGFALLCGWLCCYLVDSDVSDGLMDRFVKAIKDNNHDASGT